MTSLEKSTERNNVVAEIGRSCMLMRTRLISRVVTGLYDDELRPFGMNSPQFALLAVIANMGPASRAEIGRYHHQDRSTLTRNLKLMLAEGWIEETQDGGGRARSIILTDTGIALLRDAAPAWRVAQDQAKKLLGKEGGIAITDIAGRIMHPQPAI